MRAPRTPKGTIARAIVEADHAKDQEVADRYGVKPATIATWRFRMQEDAELAELVERLRAAGPPAPVGLVYVVRAGTTDLVKIGYTDLEIRKRLSSVQTGCPYKLSLEAVIAGGQRVEGALHRLARPNRVRDEWFKLSRSEVRDLIVALPDAEASRRLMLEALTAGQQSHLGHALIRELAAQHEADRPEAARSLLRRVIGDRLVEMRGLYLSIGVACCEATDSHAEDCPVRILTTAVEALEGPCADRP